LLLPVGGSTPADDFEETSVEIGTSESGSYELNRPEPELSTCGSFMDVNPLHDAVNNPGGAWVVGVKTTLHAKMVSKELGSENLKRGSK
jgi:hypothetical protein